jgi:acyl-CoA thioesterase YciA
MDLPGGSVAAERADGRVVTVAIEAMRFLRPIAVGDEVSCYRTTQEVGEHSIKVRIETWARARGRHTKPGKVTGGVFTFVAIDEEGHPRPLPAEADRSA